MDRVTRCSKVSRQASCLSWGRDCKICTLIKRFAAFLTFSHRCFSGPPKDTPCIRHKNRQKFFFRCLSRIFVVCFLHSCVFNMSGALLSIASNSNSNILTKPKGCDLFKNTILFLWKLKSDILIHLLGLFISLNFLTVISGQCSL